MVRVSVETLVICRSPASVAPDPSPPNPLSPRSVEKGGVKADDTDAPVVFGASTPPFSPSEGGKGVRGIGGTPNAVFVTDIYLAREAPLPGVTSEVLANTITALPNAPAVVRYVPDKADLPDALAAFVSPGDVVITLGAGDIRAAGEGLLQRLDNAG